MLSIVRRTVRTDARRDADRAGPAARRARTAMLALVLLGTPLAASAQSGSLSGLVTDSAKTRLPGAQVTLVGTRFGATSGLDGMYRVVGIPAGAYSVRVQRIGARAVTFENVAIAASGDAKLDVTLGATALQLGGYVVSASRRVEKITDAPATITRIDADQIRMSVGNSFTGALKEVKGVDFFQVGVAAVGINARGFNSAFNNRILQMEDNRIAVLPENGLPLGVLTTVSKVDIAAVEVLVGPGAALYGPDASNGVVTLLTKDPKQYPGVSVEASVGSNGGKLSEAFDNHPGQVGYSDVQGRYAGTFGRFGYKVVGEMLYARDWQNVNNYAPVAPRTIPSPEINPDWGTSYRRASGALVYYFDQGGRLEFQGGASNSNGIGITSAGRNQLKNWGYWNQQVRFTSNHWFAQAYATRSTSGQTFALNGFSTNRLAPRLATATDDSVRKVSSFPTDGRLMAAEIQSNITLPSLFNTRIVSGVQVRQDVLSSKRTFLTDALTGEDLKLQQIGVYAQTETQINPTVRFILGARYDNPAFYDPQFSPKVALLVSPTENSTFRVTFNRAFKSPSALQTDFYFRDFSPGIGVFGNKDGITVKNAAGATIRTLSPVIPELNNTFEVGYKGVLGDRLYLDVAGYVAQYKSFLSPLVVVANPFGGANATFAYNTRTNTKYVNAQGAEQIALTYYNLGKATLTGVDAGLRFVLTPHVNVTSTFSALKLDSIIQKVGDPFEATALNSPTLKGTVGMDASDLPVGMFGGFLARFVKDYQFNSGSHNGRIPGIATLDLNVGRKITHYATLNLSLQNLFACTSGTTTPPAFLAATAPATYVRGWGCGFGRKHVELLNMPAIGSMAFFGVRFDR
jgi:iron complex outermembrane receptor protein